MRRVVRGTTVALAMLAAPVGAEIWLNVPAVEPDGALPELNLPRLEGAVPANGGRLPPRHRRRSAGLRARRDRAAEHRGQSLLAASRD